LGRWDLPFKENASPHQHCFEVQGEVRFRV
jgi:hypothetical protein